MIMTDLEKFSFALYDLLESLGISYSYERN